MCDIFMLSETDYTTALTTLVATTTSVAASTSTVTATTIDDNDTPEKEAEEDIILPADSNSESDSSSAVSLPYFYGNQETSNKIKATDHGIVGTGFLKITVNGIEMPQRNTNRSRIKHNPLQSCGVWQNADLFDLGASIYTAFNAIHGTTTDGIFDAGQTIDKIKCVRSSGAEEEEEEDHEAAATALDIDNNDVDNTIEDPAAASAAAVVGAALGRRNKSLWPKNNSYQDKKWGDHFDIYLALDISGGKDDASASFSFSDANNEVVATTTAYYLSDASLRDIADAAADDLIRFGSPHFRHLIDFTIENLTPSDYYTQAALYNNDENHQEETFILCKYCSHVIVQFNSSLSSHLLSSYILSLIHI